MNIVISGLSGSGKTTYSKLLAEEFNLRYISGSSLRLEHLSHDPEKFEPAFWALSLMVMLVK
jgi:adenylate kinase family enzyme